ncbi:hypothetical protein SAMN05444372_10952 [Flavobacterium micromati]|uniref:Uncharacterized protein n=1 Tax=Flavobacterium micromati TaxID=229205 RepID=A0A1M5M508_9FLAO|nr:hypothetical protein [Flavobacterium micromati]SHG72382.1 hypothetical protein SAMN05444372_10952 [Flavobacterium micromati]
MKFIFFILFLIPFSAFSQSPIKKIYLDSLWSETNETNHKYHRIIESFDAMNESYYIKDDYKFGVLQMEGNSKTEDGSSKNRIVYVL